MSDKAIEDGEGLAAEAVLQEFQSDEEDEAPQSSSAGSTPGGLPQGPSPGTDGHGSDSKDPPPKDGGGNFSLIAAIVVAGVTRAVVPGDPVRVVLGAMGFTRSGIAPSSIAAKMMSSAATANGGGVAAGSLVATLQSVGAAGHSTSSKILRGLTGFCFRGWKG